MVVSKVDLEERINNNNNNNNNNDNNEYFTLLYLTRTLACMSIPP